MRAVWVTGQSAESTGVPLQRRHRPPLDAAAQVLTRRLSLAAHSQLGAGGTASKAQGVSPASDTASSAFEYSGTVACPLVASGGTSQPGTSGTARKALGVSATAGLARDETGPEADERPGAPSQTVTQLDGIEQIPEVLRQEIIHSRPTYSRCRCYHLQACLWNARRLIQAGRGAYSSRHQHTLHRRSGLGGEGKGVSLPQRVSLTAM